MNLLNELKFLIKKLEEEKIQYALCGGMAMAVYSMPRATIDIDLMIESDSLIRTKHAIKELDFIVSAMPMEFQEGKIQIHRLTKVESGTGETLSLDLLIVTPQTKPAWDSRTKVEWEGGTLSVVSPEGLILLKTLRQSTLDQNDIDYLRSILDED